MNKLKEIQKDKMPLEKANEIGMHLEFLIAFAEILERLSDNDADPLLNLCNIKDNRLAWLFLEMNRKLRRTERLYREIWESYRVAMGHEPFPLKTR